jgi:methylglutaconyl-CoA hydratase
MTYQTLAFDLEPGIARITLNRPELRNAFNETMIAELTEAFAACGNDARVRVVVLGAGGRAFCAGADLNWMQRMAGFTAAQNRADALGLARMLETLYTLPKPVIARVQGDCYAGGIGLVAACDIAIASRAAHFCLSETRLGLIPATIAPYVIEAIGARAARRYILSAERFDAGLAQRIGLIHEAVPAELLDESIGTLVAGLLANSPHALAEAKRLVREVVARPIDRALVEDTAGRIALIRASKEGREGVAAFLEKRSPDWLIVPPRHES